MSNISTQIRQKYESLTKDQLIEAERRLEDDLVHGELMWQYKKEEIIKSWAELLHWMHDTGFYNRPIRSISSYIKNRLRMRGVSEGAIDYVSEVLSADYSIYKDPNFDTYSKRDGNPSLRSSVFETFEEMVDNVKTKDDLRKLSQAEFLEVADIFFDKEKEIRSRLRDAKDDYFAVAEEKKWRLPQLDKVSAKDPPQRFWGQSELYFDCRENARQCHVLGDYWDDIADLVYKFKPQDTISEEASKLLARYNQRVWNPITKLTIFASRGMKDILGMVADAKNCQPLLDWFITGIDKETKAGSHGSGVLHAIQTGQYIMELGKDGRSVVELPIEREFTREQCGDKIVQLLIKARNIVMMHEAERMIQKWSKETKFETVLGDPDEFYRTEMAKRGKKVPALE